MVKRQAKVLMHQTSWICMLVVAAMFLRKLTGLAAQRIKCKVVTIESQASILWVTSAQVCMYNSNTCTRIPSLTSQLKTKGQGAYNQEKPSPKRSVTSQSTQMQAATMAHHPKVNSWSQMAHNQGTIRWTPSNRDLHLPWGSNNNPKRTLLLT